jgi:hypothetical protein
VIDMLFHKGAGYFIRIGHGPGACPEIYSAGQHFLLSAGGANRGSRSLIVARPITLFLNDTAEDLAGTIHLAGPGTDFMKWNNTGVYRNFACAAGPVVVPDAFTPVEKNGDWSLFLLHDSVIAAVYSTGRLGLIAVFEDRSPAGLLKEILRANPDPRQLTRHFQFPGGSGISYDVLAPQDKWVILPEHDQPADRAFDKWPLIAGEYNR